MTVSVCVPTYRRPELLRECICSVFANEVRPMEIIISDNDLGEDSAGVVAGLEPPSGIRLRHIANVGRSVQSANIRNVFQAASFERMVLIHDDDLMVPGGVDALITAWNAEDDKVDAVYGFQYIASASGDIDLKSSQSNNYAYFRRSEYVGGQQSNLWAALVAQFPNDGYMVRKSIACNLDFPTEAEVGCIPIDCYFSIRYALLSSQKFLLISDHVSTYRQSHVSILRTPDPNARDGHLGWEALPDIDAMNALEREGLEVARRRMAPRAIEGYLATGDLQAAATILRQQFHHLDRSYYWRARILLRFAAAAIAPGRSQS
jgi:glycosyltransferase involved in cell wall biosynthesis